MLYGVQPKVLSFEQVTKTLQTTVDTDGEKVTVSITLLYCAFGCIINHAENIDSAFANISTYPK